MFTEEDRGAALSHAVALLSDDQRVEGLLLTGSLGRGQGDRWSDIDLDAVIADEADVEAVTTDWEDIAYREWPVVHHYATEFGTTRVRGFLLRDALLLDLGFTPIGDLEVWAPVKVLFDRTGRTTQIAEKWAPWSPTPDWRGEAGFAAHDVLHACVAAHRGRNWQSAYFLQRIRNRTLALASERHGFDSEDFTRVDDVPADETSPMEATLVPNLRSDVLLAAIGRATRAFLDELRRHDPALADRLAEPFDAILASGTTQPHKENEMSDTRGANPPSIILVPGFWLGAWAWDEVAATLRADGHDVTAITLPGLESADADRSSIGLEDHVNAIVRAVEAADSPVVLVVHSAAGYSGYAASDRVPEKIAAMVYVDTAPGKGAMDADFTDAEKPLDWASIEEEENLDGVSEEQKETFRQRAVPVPGAVLRDSVELTNDARNDLPSTLICTAFTAEQYQTYAKEHPEWTFLAGIPELRNTTWVDLPTSHWPMWSRPHELAKIIGHVAKVPAGAAG